MSKVTCAISGLTFTTSHLTSLVIPHTEGYVHPVFCLPKHQLHKLYTEHTRGKLVPTDSYLLFLALAHSSEQVTWRTPATLEPNLPDSVSFIEKNIAQLVAVLEKTAIIAHPSFEQPHFTVTLHNSKLDTLPNWIGAWEENIKGFYNMQASDREKEELSVLTNRLANLTLGGEDVARHVATIAVWADKAATFPLDKADLYKKTIRSCFNIDKMFNTPLDLLKEIKDYCECNIDAGSIHFHTVLEVLKQGIARHVDYLGGSSLALGYTLLPTSLSTSNPADKARIQAELLNQAEIAAIAAKAPEKEPLKQDYPSLSAYIKARLAWKVAQGKPQEGKLLEPQTTLEPQEKITPEDLDLIDTMTSDYDPQEEAYDGLTIIEPNQDTGDY